jgi:hypothetical protein
MGKRLTEVVSGLIQIGVGIRRVFFHYFLEF